MNDQARILMCPPDHFDVVDVKNPHMEGNAGSVDPANARAQWDAVRRAFEAAGYPVETLSPTPGCEDMVFAANQTFPGLDAAGRRVCVLANIACTAQNSQRKWQPRPASTSPIER